MTMCSMQWSLRDFFFFSSRRRHTRFDCDWSSDVCSSDLTLLFGATVLGVTYLLDRRTDQDYAFWLYLLGLVAFSGALTYDGVGSITYCLINLGLMLVAVLLQRKTFMVFGAIGVYSYLGHLAFYVFKNSLLFPAALTALGIAIIAAGVWYRSREAAVEAALLREIGRAHV